MHGTFDHVPRGKAVQKIAGGSPPKLNKFRKGRELSKFGMASSLTALVLTGFRIVRPMTPLHHPIASVAFLIFAAWHLYENEKPFKKKGGPAVRRGDRLIPVERNGPGEKIHDS